MSEFVSEDAAYYVANQSEQTPFYGMATLFIAGLRSEPEVEHYLGQVNVKHVYLGSHGSFYKKTGWAEMISHLLGLGYTVSMEYPADAHSFLHGQLPAEIWADRNFCPVVTMKLPHLTSLNQNATIKVDDESHAATNEGVYCVPLREVADANRFTPWHEYGQAKVLATKAELKTKRLSSKKK